MMRGLRRGRVLLLCRQIISPAFLLGLTLLTACAPVQEQARPRFFWPVGVANPKLEYINWFVSEHDLHRGERRWFEEAVLGLEYPRRVFSSPSAIAAAADGRVFVSDVDLNRVFVFDTRKHKLRRLRDSEGHDFFYTVMGLASLSDGSVLVTTVKPADVLLFGPDERVKFHFEGNHLQRPLGVAVDEQRGVVYVVDVGAHAVVLFSLDGKYITTWGARGDGEKQFNFPLDVAVGTTGQVFVLDSLNARIEVFSPEGVYLRAFGERGTEAGSFSIPKALAVSPQDHVYVTDAMQNKVVVFDNDGRFLMSFGGYHIASSAVSPGGMSLPAGIDVDSSSSVWVVDSMNRMFHQFQFLTPEYLEKHSIVEGEDYFSQRNLRPVGPDKALSVPAGSSN